MASGQTGEPAPTAGGDDFYLKSNMYCAADSNYLTAGGTKSPERKTLELHDVGIVYAKQLHFIIVLL